jgi:hypothetical protein
MVNAGQTLLCRHNSRMAASLQNGRSPCCADEGEISPACDIRPPLLSDVSKLDGVKRDFTGRSICADDGRGTT